MCVGNSRASAPIAPEVKLIFECEDGEDGDTHISVFVVPNVYHEKHKSHEHESVNEPDAHPCSRTAYIGTMSILSVSSVVVVPMESCRHTLFGGKLRA